MLNIYKYVEEFKYKHNSPKYKKDNRIERYFAGLIKNEKYVFIEIFSTSVYPQIIFSKNGTGLIWDNSYWDIYHRYLKYAKSYDSKEDLHYDENIIASVLWLFLSLRFHHIPGLSYFFALKYSTNKCKVPPFNRFIPSDYNTESGTIFSSKVFALGHEGTHGLLHIQGLDGEKTKWQNELIEELNSFAFGGQLTEEIYCDLAGALFCHSILKRSLPDVSQNAIWQIVQLISQDLIRFQSMLYVVDSYWNSYYKFFIKTAENAKEFDGKLVNESNIVNRLVTEGRQRSFLHLLKDNIERTGETIDLIDIHTKESSEELNEGIRKVTEHIDTTEIIETYNKVLRLSASETLKQRNVLIGWE